MGESITKELKVSLKGNTHHVNRFF